MEESEKLFPETECPALVLGDTLCGYLHFLYLSLYSDDYCRLADHRKGKRARTKTFHHNAPVRGSRRWYSRDR